MKGLLILAFLGLICMARSAPTPSSTPRVLDLPDYHEDDDETIHDKVKPNDDESQIDLDDDDDEEEKTTTTTTTTRRSTFVFPTRNRNLIPSRRPIQTQRTSSVRTTTTTAAPEDDQGETTNEYDGDFKYIRDFRKYFQQLLEDIKKLVRNLTGYDFVNPTQRQQYNQNEDD